MLEFFLGGGVPMFFVLATGVLALACATSFLRYPADRKIATVRALSASLLASAGAGTAMDIAAVGKQVPANPEWSAPGQLPLVLLQGLSECMAPTILGGAFLALVWLVMAAGHRKLMRASV